MNECDALLAGVPRSGTTLTCELLNLLPDTVALDEPMDVPSLTGRSHRRSDGHEPPDPAPICADIDSFLAHTRESLVTRGSAVSKHVGGNVIGDKYEEVAADGAPRAPLATLGEIQVGKQLSPGFLLLIKHTGAFTALLEPLVARFRVYATIRNPLAVLGSWQTVDFPGRQGYHPVAEEIDPKLASSLARISDRVDRQIHLMGWFFEKIAAVLRPDQIIPYEAIVESGGKELSAITERALELDRVLESRNKASLYDRETMPLLAEHLLASDGAYWDFYSRESVRELAAA